MSFYSICFSATGRTKAVADFLCQTWGETFTFLDLSDPSWTAPAPFTDGDICLVTVPAYEGRVPAPATERLSQLKGNGAQAILVATFGNRAIDDTLLELKNVLESRGFQCRAALESVTEHSILPQFGTGRPDDADKAQLTDFIRQIKDGLAAGTLPQSVAVPGKAPYAEMGGLPFKPKGNKKCIQCGLCARRCPAGAIPLNAPPHHRQGQMYQLYALYRHLPHRGTEFPRPPYGGGRCGHEKASLRPQRKRPLSKLTAVGGRNTLWPPFII